MKRELVTGLLTLSLLASMLPANAQAAEGMFGASAAGQVQTMTEGAGEDGVQTENTADIDGTQYATLAEAVAQAEEGATIRLLRDVELDASGLVNGQGALTLSKDLTLDGSGHTIRAKAGTFSVSGDNGTGPSLLNLQDGAEVTLRDVTLDGGSAAKHGLNIYPVSYTISEPTRLLSISYAVFCLKKKKPNKAHEKRTHHVCLLLLINKKQRSHVSGLKVRKNMQNRNLAESTKRTE